MLMTTVMLVLAQVGMVPADAAKNLCARPSWAVPTDIGRSCDFAEVSRKAGDGVPATYVGSRTHTHFTVERLGHSAPGFALLVSDYVAPGREARRDAQLVANGGWIDSEGRAQSPGNTWTVKLANTDVPAKRAGTLVSLVAVHAPHSGDACDKAEQNMITADNTGQSVVCPSDVNWNARPE